MLELSVCHTQLYVGNTVFIESVLYDITHWLIPMSSPASVASSNNPTLISGWQRTTASFLTFSVLHDVWLEHRPSRFNGIASKGNVYALILSVLPFTLTLCVSDVWLQSGYVELGLYVGKHDLQERALLPWPWQLWPGKHKWQNSFTGQSPAL